MFSLPCNPAARRYTVHMFGAAAFCVFFALVSAVVFRMKHPHGLFAYFVAILPALPIVSALIGTGVYLREEKDEFQRNLFIQALLAGIGVTLAATTIWGYLEDFAQAPHLDLVWVYPVFWLFVAVSIPVIKARYR